MIPARENLKNNSLLEQIKGKVMVDSWFSSCSSLVCWKSLIGTNRSDVEGGIWTVIKKLEASVKLGTDTIVNAWILDGSVRTGAINIEGKNHKT